MLASSHLLLVTNGAVIGGAREQFSTNSNVVSAREFTSVVSD